MEYMSFCGGLFGYRKGNPHMNILLTAISAKYIHSNLAVYSLKAASGPYESMVTLAEYTINHRTDDIFSSIYRKKPDLLFFSCYIWNRTEILEVAANIRKVLPHTVVWVGGPEVSYDASELLAENPQIDGVMTGEGERTFKRLLEYYVDHVGTLGDIPGIVYRERCESGNAGEEAGEGSSGENAGIRYQRPEDTMKSLDGLPFVYHHIEDFANRIIYYESSRGCPFSCSYCLSSIDRRVRFRSPELVERELEFFLEHRVPQVKFVDRTFNCNHSHAQRIWRFIQEHDNGVTNFHFEIAADLLNEEELALLSAMRPGLVQLEIGIQTVNERTLEAIHRTASFSQIADRVRRIAAHRNIHQHLDLIAGLPYEDFESFCTSFDAVYSLKPQDLQLGFLKVLKGSEMYLRREEYGLVYRSRPPYEVLATRWISYDELLRLKEVEEMLEVYYNSQQFRNTMEELELYFDRPFDMYASLADYYKEEKLQDKAHSRQQRFSILREFIRKTVAVRQGYRRRRQDDSRIAGCMWSVPQTEQEALQQFDERLTLDLYLRENVRSRPEWAENNSENYDRIAAFYRNEEQVRAVLPSYGEMNWKQMMRMTHVERFGRLGDDTDGAWILFDYENRDPLTYDAAVHRIRI